MFVKFAFIKLLTHMHIEFLTRSDTKDPIAALISSSVMFSVESFIIRSLPNNPVDFQKSLLFEGMSLNKD